MAEAEERPLQIFIDEDNEPLAVFLPYSLPNRKAYVQKITQHGGKPVASEAFPELMRIGDPARAANLSDNFYSFKYIDECIEQGALVDPTPFFIVPGPRTEAPERRATTSSARNQFTPDDDEIIRRIVHRTDIATSGNKIYQLIEAKFGGHSFHSWRDRYLRHLQPIWGRPTEETNVELDELEQKLVTESGQRGRRDAAQVPIQPVPGAAASDVAAYRLTGAREPFTEPDDRLLLRYVKRFGSSITTFKAMALDHKQHTYESWRNRIRVLKNRNGGELPTLADLRDDPALFEDDDEEIEDVQQARAAEEEVPIDPQTAEPAPEADENEAPAAAAAAALSTPAPRRGRGRPRKSPSLARGDTAVAAESVQPTTSPARSKRATRATQEAPSGQANAQLAAVVVTQSSTGQRRIHIHDANIDQRDEPVSDIEDSTTVAATAPPRGKAVAKRGKMRATRSGASAGQRVPQTPLKQVEGQAADPKSAKLVHHEKTLSKPTAVSESLKPPTSMGLEKTKATAAASRSTRSAAGRAGSAEPVSSQHFVRAAEMPSSPVAGRDDLSEDDARASDLLRSSTKLRRPLQELVPLLEVELDADLDTDGMDAEDLLAAASIEAAASGQSKSARAAAAAAGGSSNRKRKATTPQQREVRKTPNSSPVLPPVSQLKSALRGSTRRTEPASPTPLSPAKRSATAASLGPASARRNARFAVDAVQEEEEEEDEEDDAALEDEVFNTQAVEEDEAADEEEGDEEDEEEEEDEELPSVERMQWHVRAANEFSLPQERADEIWEQVMGDPALLLLVADAVARGQPVPRQPGIWTKQDDALVLSDRPQDVRIVDKFHKGSGESRIQWLSRYDE